jgi:DNA-binding MarR family transcriptional regulator
MTRKGRRRPGSGKHPDRSLREACEQVVFASVRMARIEANENGLSLPQAFLVRALARSGTVPITKLVKWSGNSRATVGGILDGLAEAGVVRREHGIEDRRQVLVSLTPEGKALAERLEARSVERWAPLEDRMGNDDAARTAEVLQEIATELYGWKVDLGHQDLSPLSRARHGRAAAAELP